MGNAAADPRSPADATGARRRLLFPMDHSLDFVELLGDGGVIHGVSAAITSLAGYEPTDLIGHHYKDVIHPDDCAAAATAFAQVLEQGHAGPVTLRYHRKDGEWRTIQATARNCLTEPAAQAIIVLTRYITHQIRAETSLAEANLELHQLSQQLILAQETERNHLARELHDDGHSC
jgi:PAS domain S-box-containing protein